jgi:hypothetical protein
MSLGQPGCQQKDSAVGGLLAELGATTIFRGRPRLASRTMRESRTIRGTNQTRPSDLTNGMVRFFGLSAQPAQVGTAFRIPKDFKESWSGDQAFHF